MTLKITIKMDNAAFEPSQEIEAARILKKVASEVENGLLFGSWTFNLIDINGNLVGEAKVTK